MGRLRAPRLSRVSALSRVWALPRRPPLASGDGAQWDGLLGRGSCLSPEQQGPTPGEGDTPTSWSWGLVLGASPSERTLYSRMVRREAGTFSIVNRGSPLAGTGVSLLKLFLLLNPTCT